MKLHSSQPLVRGILVSLLAALTSCGAPQQKPIPAGAPPLGRYDKAQITSLAESLLTELKVGDDLRRNALLRLEEYLAGPAGAARLEKEGVNGVGAFQAGSGGFIVTGGGGNGIVSFAGGRQKVPFEASGVSAGANFGGGNHVGVVLILGLDHEQRFPDRYAMSGTGGSYGDDSSLLLSGSAERGPHQLVCVASGIGFGGRTGGGTLTITVDGGS